MMTISTTEPATIRRRVSRTRGRTRRSRTESEEGMAPTYGALPVIALRAGRIASGPAGSLSGPAGSLSGQVDGSRAAARDEGPDRLVVGELEADPLRAEYGQRVVPVLRPRCPHDVAGRGVDPD